MNKKNINTVINADLCDMFYERYTSDERRRILEELIIRVLSGTFRFSSESIQDRVNALKEKME